MLPDRLPWFIAGPAIGLLVVILYALANKRLGVTQSYVQLSKVILGRPVVERWRLWWFGGMALGALLPGAALVPLLFLGGALMGYGARWSGGCTSGHGISGNAGLSPASIAATATFMATAIAVTFGIHFLTGGAL